MNSPDRVLQPADESPLDLGSVVAALSSRFVVVPAARQAVRRIGLDTFDHHLREAGLTLEHQIVGPGERLVLSTAGGSSPVAVPVKDLRWPAMADVLPSGPLRDAITAVAGIRALMVVSDQRRRVQQIALQNEDGKTVVRLELDEPASGSSPSPLRPTEVTLRTLRGYGAPARRAALLLADAGLLPVEAPEVDLVEDLPPTLTADSPATTLLSTALHDFLTAMERNLPGLLDDVDTEFLHDFRVAVRRTRSVLKLGRPVLPEVFRSQWEPAFKWLGDLTTPVRDLDVYELDLPTMAGWLVATDPADLEPFATHLRTRRTAERRVLVRGLRSARFRRLLTEYAQELAQLGEAVPDDARVPDDDVREQFSAGELAQRSISRAYQRVARGGAAISGDSPAQDLHDLRKRCKELRYALEVFAPVIAETARKRAVSDLKGLQDVLGRFQDTEVQRLALRGFAEEMMADGTRATAVLVMGELIGHLDAEQDRARGEFDVAFARFTRPSSVRLMHQLGGPR